MNTTNADEPIAHFVYALVNISDVHIAKKTSFFIHYHDNTLICVLSVLVKYYPLKYSWLQFFLFSIFAILSGGYDTVSADGCYHGYNIVILYT